MGGVHPPERPDRAAVGRGRGTGPGERRGDGAGGAVRGPRRGEDLLDPTILLLGVVVGLLSSAIPYAVDLVALRRIRPDVFSILRCLEPAAAAFAGIVVLGEFLSPLQWLAVASVMVASVGATRSQEPIAEPVLD